MGFSLRNSAQRAERRLGGTARRPRSDRGSLRIADAVVALARPLLLGQERPDLKQVHAELSARCVAEGLSAPSRGTLYNLLARIPGHVHSIGELPPHIRDLLYNLDPEGEIQGAQLILYCANYGNDRAMSFAASLPWLDLYQAMQLRGFRPRSRGVVEAICRARGIR